jgi:hypothetical protein
MKYLLSAFLLAASCHRGTIAGHGGDFYEELMVHYCGASVRCGLTPAEAGWSCVVEHTSGYYADRNPEANTLYRLDASDWETCLDETDGLTCEGVEIGLLGTTCYLWDFLKDNPLE